MALDHDHSRVVQDKGLTQKALVDTPEIPELRSKQSLVSEKSINEISTLAKDTRSQFNTDKPANDHQARAQAIIAKIDGIGKQNGQTQENKPQIRPSMS